MLRKSVTASPYNSYNNKVMRKSLTIKVLSSESGQPLIILVLVILALSSGAGIWLVSGKWLNTEQSYQQTTEKLKKLALAIRPENFNQYTATRSYSQDAGVVPTALTGLISNADAISACALSATTRQMSGWCGPYWGVQFSGEANFTDGWGNTLVYNTSTCSLTSYGPDGASGTDDLVVKVGNNAYKNTILADRPVGYWRLGEMSGTVANDISPSGNNGTYTNGPTLGQSGGLLGDLDTSASFDGVNDYVTIPDATNLTFTETQGFSISAWAYPTTTGASLGLVTKGRETTDWYGIWQDGTNWVYGTNGGNMTHASLTQNSWHYVVIVQNIGSSARYLYVNGAQVTTNGTFYTSLASPLYIGRSGTGEYFSGKIDEVAIFNYPLTTAQILNHYNIGKCIK